MEDKMITNTPLSEQPHIAIVGIRNSGKSSLINNIFNREVSIVSDIAGTTTDPVTKSFELIPVGPVVFIDTAGFDDDQKIVGEKRVEKTFNRLKNSNIIIFVTKSNTELSEYEKKILEKIKNLKKHIIFALTFSDKGTFENKINKIKTILSNYEKFNAENIIYINNINKEGVEDLKNRLISILNKTKIEITPVEGLVNENDLVLLVTPIDLAAPKGRLILPQVETIRDLLDKDCAALIVKEKELKYFYDSLKIKPKLVITDSQVFSKVAADIPDNQMLTSFSILFARKKGDLKFFIEGIKKIEQTPANAKILVLEACSHHRQADDIGTVKIPRLFKQIVRSDVTFEFSKTLPSKEKLKEYSLVINCAGCMVTREKMLNRIEILKKNNIYAINYGLFLAWANGLLPRALEPFEMEYQIYVEMR